MKEPYTIGVSSMLATHTDLEVRLCASASFRSHLNQLANTLDIKL